MRVPMPCRDSESFLERVQGVLRGGGPLGGCPFNVDLWMEPLNTTLEKMLEELVLHSDSPPFKGFETRAEREERERVLMAMELRQGRCVVPIIRMLERMWENMPLHVREDFLRAHNKVRTSRGSNRRYYVILLSPRIYREYLEFKIKLEGRKAKAIARYMKVWRDRTNAGSGFDEHAPVDSTLLMVADFLARKESDSDGALPAAKEEEASTAVAGTASVTAAPPAATDSTDDDANPIVVENEEEIAAVPTTVAAQESEQRVQPKCEVITDSSLGEIGVLSLGFDLGVADELVLLGHPEEEVVLLEDPVSESVEDGDSSSIDGARSISSSSSSSSSESRSNNSSGGTFVSWEGARKYPFDRGKRSPRGAGTGGNDVLGVAHPFDRGKDLAFGGANGERKGFGCWMGG